MNTQQNDEALLIDLCLRQLDEKSASQVRQRLAQEPALRALHQNITNSLDAVNLLPEYEAPENLVNRAMARIRQAQQTDALIAREDTGRGAFRPTFSLREALVMAASLLIVAFLFIPSVRQARRVAQIGQCGSNMGQIGNAIQSYANANNGQLPSAGGQGLQWLPNSGRGVSNSSALYKLVAGRYAQQIIFVCPAVESGGNFAVAPGMTDFPSGKNIHYSYQHMVGPRGLSEHDPALAAAKANMAILADSTPFYRDGGFEADDAATATSDNHGRTGQNVLYLDMHVGWAKGPAVGVNGNNIFLAEGIYNYRGNETPISPTDTFLLPAYSAKK